MVEIMLGQGLFLKEMVCLGAKVIVLEDMPLKLDDNITYVMVEDTNIALGIIAANFYDNPSEKIKLVGLTGTNGKTTIVSLLTQLFSIMNVKVGMLSTIQNKIVDKIIPSTHTTPDALQTNFLLNEKKVLEVGPGFEPHIKFKKLNCEEYHCVELSKSDELKEYFRYTDMDYMEQEEIDVLTDFYKSIRRKEVLKEVLNKFVNKI